MTPVSYHKRKTHETRGRALQRPSPLVAFISCDQLDDTLDLARPGNVSIARRGSRAAEKLLRISTGRYPAEDYPAAPQA